MAALVVTKKVLEATGRELGPDLALTFDGITAPITNASVTGINVVGGAAAGYDVSKFNITEVLNVIAYTSNVVRTATALDQTHSAFIATYNGITTGGAYDVAAGVLAPGLAAQATAGTPPFDSLYIDASAVIFDFNTLTYTSPGGAGLQLPQCLLKRSNTADGTPENANVLLNPLVIPREPEIKQFIGDVLRQGLHILYQTRTIFGPKGWTALFSQVKGGGGTGKTHAKRTHRQHRRRYSSKQY
jgi:hypothetical protein